MYSSFVDTGMLACTLDANGASERQNAQLLGISAAFNRGGGRGGNGGDGGGGGRRMQEGFGGGFGRQTEPVCTQICATAIGELIAACQDYIPIASQFAEPCATENVVEGGFDPSCLAGIDVLVGVCGLNGPGDLLSECSAECGGFASPWWTECRDHIGPILEETDPAGSLVLEGFIGRCPTPCVDYTEEEIIESVVSAPLSQSMFQTAAASAAGITADEISVLQMKHITVFGLSVPGQPSDLVDADSSLAALISEGIAAAASVEFLAVTVLSGTRTSENQMIIEMMAQASVDADAASTSVADWVESTNLDGGAAIIELLVNLTSLPPDRLVLVRPPLIETEVEYTIPNGVTPPGNVAVMMALDVYATVSTASRIVPVINIRDDGSVCGSDGSVCDTSGAGGGDGPPLPPMCSNGSAMMATDVNMDEVVNVVDLLALLGAFGCTCGAGC